MNRVVSWFSCGAASAYATYLASKKYANIEAVYCRVKEEHPDNLVFLKQFEEKTGIKVEIIGYDSMDSSIYNVFRNRNFIKGPQGAPCTMILKKWVRQRYEKPTDLQIFGYTVEEQNRIDRFIDSNNHVNTDFILADQGITKQECMDWLLEMGFDMPTMYKLGYPNNNCVGCVKGGMGYWNAIRVDFPDAFDRMAKLEREIGHAVNKDSNGPVYLDELDPSRGNFKRDVPADCGFTCESKEIENESY